MLDRGRRKRETSKTLLETRRSRKWYETLKMAMAGGVRFEGCMWAVPEGESREPNTAETTRRLQTENRHPLWNEPEKKGRHHTPLPTPRPAQSQVPRLAPISSLQVSSCSISAVPPRREEWHGRTLFPTDTLLQIQFLARNFHRVPIVARTQDPYWYQAERVV